MIASRVSRRAAAIVSVSLVAAGTAAAAAGGVLPNPLSSDPAPVVVETTEPTESTETTISTDSTLPEIVEVPGLADEVAVEAMHDLCETWFEGDVLEIPTEVQAAADEQAMTVDDYCALVHDAHESYEDESDDDSDESEDESEDSSTEDESEDD